MKKTNIYYWIFTGLFAAFMLSSTIPNIMLDKASIEMIGTLMGYPNYFIRFIGIAKLLGIIAILMPGFPRLKEWAYAGLLFDLVGAVYSMFSTMPPSIDWLVMLIPFVLFALSYYFHHKRLSAAEIALPKKQAKELKTY
ncbi:MAG: DoxX family protein [Bacteroidota bacterium]